MNLRPEENPEDAKGSEESDDIETLEMVERARGRPFWRLSLSEFLFYGLIILAVVGVVITRTSIELGRTYWLAMIPFIALASLYVEWSRTRGRGIRWSTLLRTQLLQWGALIVSIELVYMLHGLGQIDRVTISAIVLLLMAQTTFAVGIYLDWRFAVVGVFLAVCMIVISYLQIYIWVMALIAGGMIAVGMYLHRKFDL